MTRLLKLALLIFVASCTNDTPSPISCAATATAVSTICQPIYGRANDWRVISDELARNIYRHNKMCESIGK